MEISGISHSPVIAPGSAASLPPLRATPSPAVEISRIAQTPARDTSELFREAAAIFDLSADAQTANLDVVNFNEPDVPEFLRQTAQLLQASGSGVSAGYTSQGAAAAEAPIGALITVSV